MENYNILLGYVIMMYSYHNSCVASFEFRNVLKYWLKIYKNHLCALRWRNKYKWSNEPTNQLVVGHYVGSLIFVYSLQCTYMIFIYLQSLFTTWKVYLAGLLAQSVERCTGIAEVMGLNPLRTWFVFRSYFNNKFRSVRSCEDRLYFVLKCVVNVYKDSIN